MRKGILIVLLSTKIVSANVGFGGFGFSSPLFFEVLMGTILNEKKNILPIGFGSIGLTGFDLNQGIGFKLGTKLVSGLSFNETYVWYSRLPPYKSNEGYIGGNIFFIPVGGTTAEFSAGKFWIGINERILPSLRSGWYINAGVALLSF